MNIVLCILIGFICIFIGLSIYGIINEHKHRKIGDEFYSSKYVWIGLIGMNVSNIILQAVNLVNRM